ncbi:protein toll-like [Bactrocera dorsalis]|uniref:Protein toll-like n=1 Tax=Bactrocera dorsalis TaxID=27457 RepID=A0ABM3J0U3_BACDO|nr:protein toll-like [Bactrocera dorsalis]
MYMNNIEWVLLKNLNEANKLTLVFNIDLAPNSRVNFSTEWKETNLQLIFKSNRNEIREADIISIFTDILYEDNQVETLTFSVQGLRNQYISLPHLTQTFFMLRHSYALKQLNLARNNIRILDAYTFVGVTLLNYLNLSRNEIKELPESLFACQRQLLVLDLSHNLLTYLKPHLFDHTPWLWQLKLAGNHLHDITNLMENLKPLLYLHRLDVSQNKLQTIWGTETSINRTSMLLTKFRYSMSWDFGEGLYYITKLKPENHEGGEINSTVINLSGNSLREFTLDWLVFANITCPFEINLEHNLIENIFALQKTDDCALELKLTGNPIVCDCKLAWIYSENYRSLLNGLQCVQTSTKLVKDLAQLERNELCAWEPVMCPRKCNCYTQFEFLHINCKGAQHIEQLPRPEQVGLKTSVLDISNNNFIELPLNTTFGYGNVSKLNASHNQITSINISQLPTNLTVLDLRNNHLKSLDDEFLRTYLNDSTKLQYLYLSGNHWICDCSTQKLVYTIRTHRTRISDADQLLCYSTTLLNDTLLIDNVRELCPTPVNVEYYQNMNTTVISVGLTIIVLLCIIALFYKYKLEVEVWLYSHNMLRFCISECELDKHKTFDAFISYAHQDADFVNHTLLPQLEQCEPPFRVCTHERNWLAGAYIPEQIIESVDQSRRTIIVLSQHFIESDWARMEFRTAHQCSLNEGRARIIMIKYGEITKTDLLDRELRAYLDMNTYLDWQDVGFWDKLRYAMPHKRRGERSSDMLKTNGRMYVMRQVEVNRLREEIV